MADNSQESKTDLVKEAHRRVFEAITQLTDVVEEEFLYQKVSRYISNFETNFF